jgi:hypothetical protein
VTAALLAFKWLHFVHFTDTAGHHPGELMFFAYECATSLHRLTTTTFARFHRTLLKQVRKRSDLGPPRDPYENNKSGGHWRAFP